ncbi:HAMP domain-containing protein [Deinococcus piscis]|uniref:HAMP domain-containing protein n=1 Tax=Deinococcus piscis TaxID=394230 RepID=A0ABQ3KAQ7_9DEIO|nr:HAMP domain-containing protein [Deinococcus piscis]GHG07586.1 HAMP domain-containing protein [Deinococcus piscis]
MKYTVVIQHPVQDEVRAELEQQLSQRLGLSAAAAGKLAGRRSGRLLKPTTRAKAEKLLGIYSAVGAAVNLEEVPEEGEISSLSGAVHVGAAQGPVPGTDSGAFSPHADPFGASAGAADPFSAAPFAADPFGTDTFGGAPFGSDPFGTDPFGESAAQGAGHTQVFSAVPGTVALASDRADRKDAGAVDEWASFTQELGGSAAADRRPADASEDVWADFADSLKVDVPVQSGVEVTPAPLATSFMDVADGAALPMVSGPRRSLGRELLLTSLLPTAALSLLSLLLLLLLLPAAERSRTTAQADTLAHTLSTTLSAAADAPTLQSQLRTLVDDDKIGFLQVSFPGGPTYFASDVQDEQAQALQQAFAKWQGSGANGVFRSGESYLVGQAGGQAVDAGTTSATQVTVGVPYTSSLGRVVPPWVLASLLLLGLTALWARRAAQALLSPVQRLVRAADAISSGDLSQPVRAEANDELGDLAQALERMRLSLSAAMDRLRRRKR